MNANISFFKEKNICYTIHLDYDANLMSLLRRILKRDALVLQVGVIKDNTFIPLSRYHDLLSDGKYHIFFPQKNEIPHEYDVEIIRTY